MVKFLKAVGFVLLAILVFTAATGIGVFLSALSSIIGFALLGAGTIFFAAMLIKEWVGSQSKKRDR